MTKKIVLVSDNHLNSDILQKIYNQHLDADYFLHCGDSELLPENIKPFISVRGNNDLSDLYPDHLIFKIEDLNILMLHGHRYITLKSYDSLIYKAMELNANICLFGHTHRFADFEDSGIRFINPGSCNNSRDIEGPSYAILYINNNNKLEVVKYLIKRDYNYDK